MSPRGIILTDSLTSQLIENVSIYRYAVQGLARVYSATRGDVRRVLSETRPYQFPSGPREPEFPSSVKWAGGRSCHPVRLCSAIEKPRAPREAGVVGTAVS